MKRAGLYLIRKKGRTLLLLCLFLLMTFSVMVGISFKESAERELDSLRRSLASGFVLKVDFENKLYTEHVDFENGGGASVYAGPMINDDMIEKICSIDGIKDYICDLFGFVMWTNLELRPALYAHMEPDPKDPLCSEDSIQLSRQTAGICFCRNGAAQKNFRTGALVIAEGRNIAEGDHFKAVVSDWLAKHNQLSVGDTITLEAKEGLYQFSGEPLRTWGEATELEVVGIFHANFSQDTSNYVAEHSVIENYIYTDMDVYRKLLEDERQEGYERVALDEYQIVEFLVDDPKELDSIMQQVKSREDIDFENLEFVVDDMDYQAAAKPYSQIRVFSMLLLALGLGGLGVILYLVIKLWIQGRKHETGILRAMGMRKREILGQMLTECLLVSVAAFAIAFLLSGFVMDRCAAAAEHVTAPRADAQEYEVRVSKYFIPEISKTSSEKAVLDRALSGNAMFFAAIFVCGISCVSVIVSFADISSAELKRLLI